MDLCNGVFSLERSLVVIDLFILEWMGDEREDEEEVIPSLASVFCLRIEGVKDAFPTRSDPLAGNGLL